MISNKMFNLMVEEIREKLSEMEDKFSKKDYYTDAYIEELSGKIISVHKSLCE